MRPNLPFALETVGLILFLVFMATQVVLPLIKDRPLFPMFNKRRRKAESALAKTLDEGDTVTVEQTLRRAQERIRRNLEQPQANSKFERPTPRPDTTSKPTTKRKPTK